MSMKHFQVNSYVWRSFVVVKAQLSLFILQANDNLNWKL